MNKTKIEWADMVWNPVTGCSKVSSGCENCYAERHAKRFWGGREFTDVQIHPEKLDEPLHRKKPSVIFVNSMSDLFHGVVPNFFIEKVFEVMNACHQHIFLVLTKRPECADLYFDVAKRPNKNIWLGVSVEGQKSAEERIPKLFKLPTQNLFVSAEPLLELFDISQYLDRVKWVIAGGESGPNARPMHPDWALTIQAQCREAEVPFFFKQNGEWEPSLDVPVPHARCNLNGGIMVRVGKKVAGRFLDGREYLEYPEAIKKIREKKNDKI